MITEPVEITIPLRPFTKKNSSRIVKTKSGVPFLIPSAAYEQYERDCAAFIRCKGLEVSCPINIRALFYIDADRKCDLSNYFEAIADILVHYHVIEDDHRKIVAGWDGSRIYVDRANPRTVVTLEPIPQGQIELDIEATKDF